MRFQRLTGIAARRPGLKLSRDCYGAAKGPSRPLQFSDCSPDFREIAPVSPMANASPEDYLQNQVKVLQSDALARRVARQLGPIPQEKPAALHAWLGLAKKPLAFLFPLEAGNPRNSEEQRIERIEKSITVRTGLRSQIIDLFFDAPDPVLAARGANVSVSEFMNLNRRRDSSWCREPRSG